DLRGAVEIGGEVAGLPDGAAAGAGDDQVPAGLQRGATRRYGDLRKRPQQGAVFGERKEAVGPIAELEPAAVRGAALAGEQRLSRPQELCGAQAGRAA